MKLDQLNKHAVRSSSKVAKRVTTLSSEELESVVAGAAVCCCCYRYSVSELVLKSTDA